MSPWVIGSVCSLCWDCPVAWSPCVLNQFLAVAAGLLTKRVDVVPPPACFRSASFIPLWSGPLLIRLCFYWLSMSTSNLFLIDRPEGILAPLRCEWLFTNTLFTMSLCSQTLQDTVRWRLRHWSLELKECVSKLCHLLPIYLITTVRGLSFPYLPTGSKMIVTVALTHIAHWCFAFVFHCSRYNQVPAFLSLSVVRCTVDSCTFWAIWSHNSYPASAFLSFYSFPAALGRLRHLLTGYFPI